MCSRASIQAKLTKLTGLTAIQTAQPISYEEKVFEPRPLLRKEAHGQTKIQYYLFNQGDTNFQDPALRGKFYVIGDFLAQRASNAENVSVWWRHRAYTSGREQFQHTNASSFMKITNNCSFILYMLKYINAGFDQLHYPFSN